MGIQSLCVVLVDSLIWDTTFHAAHAGVDFLVAFEMERWAGYRGWILFGALWALAGWPIQRCFFLPCCGLDMVAEI